MPLRISRGLVIAVIGIAFLLAAAPLQHVIVISLEMFAALHVGASFGYADWLGTVAWAVLGNIIGGVSLVSALNHAQVVSGK